ncbi:hypothetical protein K435DRAFT_844023 [Dendrothele bispora CBS 962.96]|uniref:Uncharacterized protein n=1 Tax=Dendrothele bispora (strain CBS 962.96) TaxID=1314807 RepID=A0A4S8L4K9_DENBC|nr:hypothetical protein K435DRAFT_844023 [Dendrothele bispora CBS 962.96]
MTWGSVTFFCFLWFFSLHFQDVVCSDGLKILAITQPACIGQTLVITWEGAIREYPVELHGSNGKKHTANVDVGNSTSFSTFIPEGSTPGFGHPRTSEPSSPQSRTQTTNLGTSNDGTQTPVGSAPRISASLQPSTTRFPSQTPSGFPSTDRPFEPSRTHVTNWGMPDNDKSHTSANVLRSIPSGVDCLSNAIGDVSVVVPRAINFPSSNSTIPVTNSSSLSPVSSISSGPSLSPFQAGHKFIDPLPSPMIPPSSPPLSSSPPSQSSPTSPAPTSNVPPQPTTLPTQNPSSGVISSKKPEESLSSISLGSQARPSKEFQTDIQQSLDVVSKTIFRQVDTLTTNSESQTQGTSSSMLVTVISPDGSTSTIITLLGSVPDPRIIGNPSPTPSLSDSSPSESPSSPFDGRIRTNHRGQLTGAIVGSLVGAFVILKFSFLAGVRLIRWRRTRQWKRFDPFPVHNQDLEAEQSTALECDSESKFLARDSYSASLGILPAQSPTQSESLIRTPSERVIRDNVEQNEGGSDSTSIGAVLPSRTSQSQASDEVGKDAKKEKVIMSQVERIPRGTGLPPLLPAIERDSFSDSHMVMDSITSSVSNSPNYPAIGSETLSALISSNQVPLAITSSWDRGVAEVDRRVECIGSRAEIEHLGPGVESVDLPPPAYTRLPPAYPFVVDYRQF